MTDISIFIETIEKYERIVLALEDPRIDEAAKKIAYYNAMIDAAHDDPMDDPEEQTAILDYLNENLKNHVEHYQSLVNEHL